MRIHYLQHVPYETPGVIAEWASARGFELAGTGLGGGDDLPGTDAFDWLVVMGGPMSVHDEDTCPWLPAEKRLIAAAMAGGKVVLGVCLGAQLVAEAAGGTVTRNATPEIGWYPVTLTAPAWGSPVFRALPEEFTALHWHGDTFSLPHGAVHMAESAACRDQAFAIGSRVFGLQFHLECTERGLAALVEAASDDLDEGGPWVQPAEEILGRREERQRAAELMVTLLDGIAAATS
jgi:GMP synthase-like glutamine amidotransferase